MTRRIGIPRALFFYTYLPFWHTFWTELGCEVVVSPATNKEILDLGVKEASTDLCLPVKVFHGHVAFLAKRVDAIFLPRMVDVGSRDTFCPKFLALPEMVQYSLSGLPTVVESRVNLSHPWNLFYLCRELQHKWAPKKNFWTAYQRARAAQKHFMAVVQQGELVPRALGPYLGDSVAMPVLNVAKPGLTVAVLGYPYAVHDSFINADVLKKLVALGARVLTADMLPARERQRYRLRKDLFWHYSNMVVQAGRYWLEEGRQVDGLVHITNFACGPDAMVGKLLELESKVRGLPLLTLTLDEQTGYVGLDTRIEAFVDMLVRRKSGAHNVPVYG